MRRMKALFIALAAVAVIPALAAAAPTGDAMKAKESLAKFARVRIEADPKLLTGRERRLVEELARAAAVMDEIFLRQVFERNPELLAGLEKERAKAPELYDLFRINMGPWDRLDHDRPFIDGVGQKPAGATFYPADLTKAEFQRWIAAHPSDRDAFESNFTVIRRDGRGLRAVPFSEVYRDLLERAAGHLRKAATLTENRSLRTYLATRAEAFLSNDYFQSDVDWVRLKDHSIEVVIGPYEVYEDNLLGLKAAFEAYVTRVDPKESERLSKVVGHLDELQKQLPVEDRYKGIGRNLSSPIVVAQLLTTGGEARAGVQTLAFNLPNDERVREQEGSKKVMLKNVQQAKFEKILKPIAAQVMLPEEVAEVDFEAFFAHTLLHEISHGIGPGNIEKEGRKTTVNKELKDLYSVLEECKADTLGVTNALYLTKKGLYPKTFEEAIWPTYLAGLFRSVRFGIKEAHGGGNAIQFQYLFEKGGITFDPKSGLFGVDRKRIAEALRQLAREVLMIEAKGDYAAAKAFVARYRVMRPELKKGIERLAAVPVDIWPSYAFE